MRISASGYEERRLNVNLAAGATYVVELDRENPVERDEPAEETEPDTPALPPIFYPTE